MKGTGQIECFAFASASTEDHLSLWASASYTLVIKISLSNDSAREDPDTGSRSRLPTAIAVNIQG
jgi:hypothetical protein